MSLHEGEENQPSSYFMLEVLLEAVAVGKDVDNKYMEEEEKILDDVASQGNRSRKLTEKGRRMKLSTLSNTRRKMNSRLAQQFETIEDLMYSSCTHQAQLDYIFKQLLLVHQKYLSFLEDDEKLADEGWFEEVDERVFTFKHKVYNWLKEAETERSAKKVYSKKGSKSTSSGSSRKTKSSNSGSSRCSKERAMEEKAKLAELMAEVEFMQQRQMAENRAEQLRVQEKLAKAKARSEVYEAMERKGSEVDKSEIIRGSKVDTVIGQQEIIHKHQVKSAAADNNIQAPTGKISNHYEKDGKATSKSTMKKNKYTEELSPMMCNLLRHQSAPNVEIETFRGNPLDYHYFMSVFKKAVEYKIDDPHRRLVRLLKYTEGEARETIKHYIQQPVDIGYDRAKLLLEQHYRDPHSILAAY